MSLPVIKRIADVNQRRADQRKSELMRAMRIKDDVIRNKEEAKFALQNFKRERLTAVNDAYGAISGMEMNKADLDDLNLRLDRLLDQEKHLQSDVKAHEEAEVEATQQVELAAKRFMEAFRKQEKWQAIKEPLIAAASKLEEHATEIEIEDNIATMQHFRKNGTI